MTLNRIRNLDCGHSRARAVDYDERYRWVVRCCECGQVEHWTQGQWRQNLVSSTPPAGLTVGDESGRLVGANPR